MFFRAIPGNAWQCCDIPNSFGEFQAILGNSGQFQAIMCNSESFRAIPGNSGQFRVFPGNSGQFREILCNSGKFWAFSRPGPITMCNCVCFTQIKGGEGTARCNFPGLHR